MILAESVDVCIIYHPFKFHDDMPFITHVIRYLLPRTPGPEARQVTARSCGRAGALPTAGSHVAGMRLLGGRSPGSQMIG